MNTTNKEVPIGKVEWNIFSGWDMMFSMRRKYHSVEAFATKKRSDRIATETLMRHSILVLLFAGAALCAQPSEEEVKKEMKLFQGKWQATFAQSFDGQVQSEVEIDLTKIEIDGDKFTLKTGSLTVNGRFSVDPTKKIREIDVYFGDSNDNPLKGIYEIKGDTRKSCFAMPGKDRPTEFKKEKGYQTLEWRADK